MECIYLPVHTHILCCDTNGESGGCVYNHQGWMLVFLEDALSHALKSFPAFSASAQPRGSIRVTAGGDLCDKPRRWLSTGSPPACGPAWFKVGARCELSSGKTCTKQLGR